MSGFGHDQYGTDYFGKGTHAKDILWNSLPQLYKEADGEKQISYSGKVGEGQGAPTYIMLPFTAVKPGTLSLTYLASTVPTTVTDKDSDGILYSGSTILGSINYTTGRVVIYTADVSAIISAGFTYSEKYLEKFVVAVASVFEEIRFLAENFDTLIDPMGIRPDLLYNLSSNLVQLEEFWLQDEKFCRLFLDNVGLWTLRKGEVYGMKLLARCLGFEVEIVDLWEYELLPVSDGVDPNPVDDYFAVAGDEFLTDINYTTDTGDIFFCLAGQSELLSETDIRVSKPNPFPAPVGWIDYADRKRWNTNKFHIILS
jgi:hypothetical protein